MRRFRDMGQTPETPTHVGQQLARRRDELDLTQEELARRIGISTPTVSVTERGHTAISKGNRAKWERALNLKPGTISRAYRDGTDLEIAEVQAQPPYADLNDPYESDIWNLPGLSEADRRRAIDILRESRAKEREQARTNGTERRRRA